MSFFDNTRNRSEMTVDELLAATWRSKRTYTQYSDFIIGEVGKQNHTHTHLYPQLNTE